MSEEKDIIQELFNGLGIFEGDEGNKYEGEWLNADSSGVEFFLKKIVQFLWENLQEMKDKVT